MWLVILIILGLAVYISSLFYVRRYISQAHNRGGIWENSKVGREDLFITVFPLLNSIAVVVFLFNSPIKKNKKQNNFFNNFFKIKK